MNATSVSRFSYLHPLHRVEFWTSEYSLPSPNSVNATLLLYIANKNLSDPHDN